MNLGNGDFLKIYRVLGLVFSGLALAGLASFVPLIHVAPSQSIWEVAANILFLFLAPPLMIFRGFYISLTKKVADFGEIIETVTVILITVFIIHWIYANISSNNISIYFTLIYLLPLIFVLAGLFVFYRAAEKKTQSRQAYLLILAGSIIAINEVLFLLIKTGLGAQSSLSLGWILIILATFPVPSLLIFAKEIFKIKSSNYEATFLIWVGLGNMSLATIVGGFSIGPIYFIFLILLVITALLLEFSS